MKVLIVKTSSLGDIIHTLPCLAGLKQNGADVSWLVGNSFSSLLKNHPYLKQLFIFDREKWRGIKILLNQPELWHLVRQIRQEKFDVVLDVQGLLRSSFFTLFSGTPKRIGFANARELAWLAYNQRIQVPSHIQHAVDRNAYLVEQLLGHSIPRLFPIPITQDDENKAAFLIPKLPAIVLAPGARWESKRWPLTHFIELIEMLEGSSVSIVLIGSKAELPLTQEILKRVKRGFIGNTIVHLTGETTLPQLAAVMKRSNLVISNDSGPMHIAAAVNTPVLALFGPTDPAKTGPYGANQRVLQHQLPCWPCRYRVCPKNFPCIATITPQEVFTNLQQMLAKI